MFFDVPQALVDQICSGNVQQIAKPPLLYMDEFKDVLTLADGRLGNNKEKAPVIFIIINEARGHYDEPYSIALSIEAASKIALNIMERVELLKYLEAEE